MKRDEIVNETFKSREISDSTAYKSEQFLEWLPEDIELDFAIKDGAVFLTHNFTRLKIIGDVIKVIR